MSNRCAICARAVPLKPFMIGGQPLLESVEADVAAGLGEPKPARSIGDVCGEACGLLLWATHFERFADATPDQRALTAYYVRARFAEANGQPFSEKPPKDSTDLALEKVLAEKGLTEFARELE